MANFLIESEPAAAQTMAEADSIASATRRKTAAYNALAAVYGPAAGDPDAQEKLQSNALAQQLDPLKVQQAQIDTTSKQQAYDKGQALQAIGTVKQLMDNGMSGADALNVVRQHAPELGLDDQHVADLAPLLDQNHDNVLGHLYDALSNNAGSKPTGSQVMLKGADGKVHVGYLGADGKMHVPTVPNGLEVLPKVTGAGTVVDNGDGTQSLVKMDVTGGTQASALPGHTVQSEQKDQQLKLEAARVRIAAQKEARIAQTGSQAFTPQSVDMLAQAGLAHGISLSGMGIRAGTPLAAAVTARMAQRLNDSGDTVQATIYQGQALKERQTAVNDLGKATPGSAGGQVQALSTAISHLNQYEALLPALQSGNIVAINKARQAFTAATGSPAPTNVSAVHAALGDEIARVVAGGVNSAGDRKQMQDLLQQAGSPAQAVGAVGQLKGLMAGRLGGIRQRYQAVDAGDAFDAHLTPEAKQALGSGQQPQGGAAPAATSALRQKYGL